MALTNLKVFISYPRGGHEHTWAETVQRHLETQGAACWRDEVSIAEGDPDAVDRIEQGIEAADIVVAVIGTDSEICKWQKRELLTADRLHIPVVALRLDKVTLPFTISEVQPVEERATETETLAALTDAIAQCLRTASVTARTAPAGTTAPSAQRRAEIEYLNRVVYADLADRSASYVPVAGTQRESISLHRVIRSASIPATDVLLREFRVNPQDAPAPRETTYNDVQQAYRELRSRAVRRLAVLGEPGAGKSFSLERFAFEHAQLALADPKQPIPLLVPMGRWTREAESLEDYIARQLNELGRHVGELRRAGRAILLLDGLNEIPSGQRDMKAEQVQHLAMDVRYAGVVVSCREKDFQADFKLPFDTLTLQPMSPVRIYEFMHTYLKLLRGPSGPAIAERRYWELAGSDVLREAWKKWQSAGASFELFWNADEIPRSDPNVYSKTTAEQDAAWEKARFDTRGLIRLAANPYLLAILIELGSTPSNRARLFESFLKHLHERERVAREKRHGSTPPLKDWLDALAQLAEAMQRHSLGALKSNAQTSLARSECPPSLTDATLDFSIDASALRRSGDDIAFTHQLMQEYLASRVLLEASRDHGRTADEFWPDKRWWARAGWEVVAEIAAESCEGDPAGQTALIAWLAQANPEVACDVWQHTGQPVLPETLLQQIADHWLPRMTEPRAEPDPRARASIGRALGRFGLDMRKGVGLRSDGIPDIDWVTIPGDQPFIYQNGERLTLPRFRIARYPITNRQYQAFIDAGGYTQARWWHGLAQRTEAPDEPQWSEPNSPRETVSW